MENDYQHKALTSQIIKLFYKVYNVLGCGFLEKVYEKALKYELEKASLKVDQQRPIEVYYENELIGEYYADLLVEDKVIIELKACESIRKEHENQLINYLKATDIEVGLLLNFGAEPEIRRKVFTKKRTNSTQMTQI